MENASKALIIAGAILISIVLIGVGVLIVSNAQGIFGGASDQMAELDVEQFNSKFTQYEGKQSGSKVRTLLQTLATHNQTKDDESKKIKLGGQEFGTDQLSTTKSNIKVNKIYTVSFDYETTGKISNIKIVDDAGTTLTPKQQ